MNMKDEFSRLISQLRESQIKQYQVLELSRIVGKLTEKNIEDEWIKQTMDHLLVLLKRVQGGDLSEKKEYKKLFAQLKKHLQKRYDLVPKGYFAALYMSLGLSIGTALGVVFMNSVSTSFFPIGIGAGLSIGAGIGSSRDKDAEKKGLVY